MKKIIFFVFCLITPFMANSQIVKTDSLNCVQSQIIAERLLEFHNENRVSQAMMVTGAIFYTAGMLLNNQPNSFNAIQIIGGISGGIGLVLYIDSFKFLNFKNTKNIKSKKADL